VVVVVPHEKKVADEIRAMKRTNVRMEKPVPWSE
jgi:hypothetical protein